MSAGGFLGHVSVLILTYNEEANIGRTLKALAAFPEVVVLDSGSTDATVEIAKTFANTRVETRSFDTHAAQWNHGLTQCRIATPWVLALDADYVVPDALAREIAALAPPPEIAGYRTSFRYCVAGRPLSGSLYPPVTTLFRRVGARYAQTGHTQRILAPGDVATLHHPIHHDDRKPLSRWLVAQQNYARLEAEHLLTLPQEALGWSGKIRLWAWPAPLLVFFYALVWKRCLFDGWPGWFYALQRMAAETMIALEIIDRRLGKASLAP